MKKLILLIAVGAAVSCSPARIAVEHEAWNKPQEMAVKGRQGVLINQKLSFGNYTTGSVKRSWTKGSSSFSGWAWGRPGFTDYAMIIGNQYSQSKQSVNFELADGSGSESSVFCVSRARAKDFLIGANPTSQLNVLLEIQGLKGREENIFWVKIFLKNEESPFEMMIDNIASQERRKDYWGVVAQSREKYYTIHPVYKMADKNNVARPMLAGSAGYEIRNPAGVPLAAVSLIDNGMVYLNTDDRDERFLMANICSALLLQEAIGS